MAVLAAFTSGVTIQCAYRDAYWPPDSYYCDATIISPENPTIVTEISGNHTDGKTNAVVGVFTMNQNGKNILTEIPSGIEKFFPNLQEFSWNRGIITKIDSSTFKPFPYLVKIIMSENRIETLDGDLFQFTKSLQWIVFDSNRLQHVGHGLFTGLYNLTYVSFQNNPCINTNGQNLLAVQTLNLDLPIKCPPTTPTPPKPIECPISCKLNEVSCKLNEVIEKIEKLKK